MKKSVTASAPPDTTPSQAAALQAWMALQGIAVQAPEAARVLKTVQRLSPGGNEPPRVSRP